MSIEAMKQALVALENLLGAVEHNAVIDPVVRYTEENITSLRQAIEQEVAKESKLLESVKWIASHDLSGADDRAIALMAYAFVSKARFAVLDATGEKCEDLHKM